MKCDELKPLIYSIADFAYVDEIRVTKNFQNPHDHAVYKATDVDAAIAELKAENERLNNALDKERSETIKYMDGLCNAKNEIERLTIDKRNVELRADVSDSTIEKLKKKMDDYHLMSDIRRAKIKELKRALWMARATIANSTRYKYHRLACKAEMDPQPHGWSCYINGEVYRTGKMNRMLEPHYWTEIWENVERKCRAKAKEYK